MICHGLANVRRCAQCGHAADASSPQIVKTPFRVSALEQAIKLHLCRAEAVKRPVAPVTLNTKSEFANFGVLLMICCAISGSGTTYSAWPSFCSMEWSRSCRPRSIRENASRLFPGRRCPNNTSNPDDGGELGAELIERVPQFPQLGVGQNPLPRRCRGRQHVRARCAGLIG